VLKTITHKILNTNYWQQNSMKMYKECLV